jgi:hypothetical protein
MDDDRAGPTSYPEEQLDLGHCWEQIGKRVAHWAEKHYFLPTD